MNRFFHPKHQNLWVNIIKIIVNKKYRGKKENGVWEEFEWSGEGEERTPENTGYVEVEPLEEN